MSESSGSEYTCQLCEKTSSSREDIILHLLKHLSYKKYPCDGCAQSFYTEAERDRHCTTTKHNHAFRFNINRYNEMLLSMLLKDMDLLKVYDSDVIVTQRARVNTEFDAIIQKCSKFAPKPPKMNQSLASLNTPVSPVVPKKAIRKASETPPVKVPAKAPSDPVPALETPVAREPRSASRERKRQRKESTGGPILEKVRPRMESTGSPIVDKMPAFATISDAINASMTTQTVNVKCGLCSKMVPWDYVARKDHVSMHHMGTDHDDSDYVAILETKMEEAFMGLKNSDLQCQWPNCTKSYPVENSRRNHFQKHATKFLSCPIAECVVQEVMCSKMKSHLKEKHGLQDGHKSMKDSHAKTAFEQEFKAHNREMERLYEMCFPCIIPKSVESSRSVSRGGASTCRMMTRVLQDMPRMFQRTPSLPVRRMSESTDSEDDSEKSTPKRNEVAKAAEKATPKSVASKSSSSEDSSNEEEEVTQFEDVKNITLLTKSTKENAPEQMEKGKKKRTNDETPEKEKKDRTEGKKKKPESSSAASDDDIVFVKIKKNKKSRKMREDEIKKEEEQDEALSYPSANSSVEEPQTLTTDEEVKEEVVVEKEEAEEEEEKGGDGGKKRNHGESNGSPVPKRHAPSTPRRDRLSSTSKSDSRDQGEQSGWQQQPRQWDHSHQPRQRRVSHNEHRKDHRSHEPRRTRWDQPAEEHHGQQQRHWGQPHKVFFPTPPPPLRPAPATGMRKKGSELNMSVDNQRRSYVIYTGPK